MFRQTSFVLFIRQCRNRYLVQIGAADGFFGRAFGFLQGRRTTAISSPMTAMTTSNSSSVKAFLPFLMHPLTILATPFCMCSVVPRL
jgi:hypothetical protein